jgi:protease-4
MFMKRPSHAEPSPDAREHWERDALLRLASAGLEEQRRARRWGIFFKFLLAAYLLALLALYWPFDLETQVMNREHTALVELDGVISADGEVSADGVVTGLRRAFEDTHTKGIILRINSPGGSAVQAGYIHDEVLRLREEYPDIPVYAVVTDMCASGGYYVAVAADEIYANRASIVGSIGVVMGSFGFTEAMDKLGVERRLLTAGEHKGFMDPFSPVKQEEVQHIRGMLEQIHGQFIQVVREGRGERLKDDDELFSGLVWSGEQALELGLVDALGSASHVALEVIGAERIVDFTRRPDYLERLTERFGVGAARAFLRTLTEP